MVVGAIGEDSSADGINEDETDDSASFSGAAYVFFRSGATWSQEAYLKASNSDGNDRFGNSVAISDDTIVVGATGEGSSANGVNGDQGNNAAAGAGAAYVFLRNGTTWSQEAYLKASNPDAGDAFGESVAISGDTLVVGAHLESSNANGVNGTQGNNAAASAGAAYVFVRNGSAWSQQAYLKASNPDANDNFGRAVAISGDTIVAGASQEGSAADGVNGGSGAEGDNSAFRAGAAYVFARSGSSWSQEAYLKASNSAGGDSFGTSVAISGNTLVVGASAEASDADGVNGDETDNSAPTAGAAYVFARAGSTWSQRAYLKASNSDAVDRFGASVSIDAGTIVVGASGEASNGFSEADNSLTGAGAAYLFQQDASGLWQQTGYLKAENVGNGGDQFGTSVAVSGGEVVVGSPFEDGDGNALNNDLSSNSGAAYTFAVPAALFQGDAYDVWIAGFYPGESDPAIIGAFADPNEDGIPNVIAFVLNGSPTTFADNDLPYALTTASDFTIIFPRWDGAADLFDPYLEFGNNLVNWDRAVNGQDLSLIHI